MPLSRGFNYGSGGGGVAAVPNHIWLPSGNVASGPELAGWRAAKAAALTAPARILSLGDSIGAGSVNSTSVTKRYPDLVLASLAATYGRYADHFTVTSDSAVFTLISDPFFVVQNAAPWAQPPSDSGWLRGLYSGTTNAQSNMKFTSPYACTAMDIVWIDQYPGTWQFVVGGGAGTYTYTLFDGQTGGTGTIGTNVTITNLSPAGNVAANTRVRKITLTGLPNAIHTIDFGWQSATATHMLGGVSTYTGNTNGIGMARVHANGAKANSMLIASACPADVVSLYSGKHPQNDATAVGTGTFGYPMNPHQLIYALLVNSCNGSDSVTSTGSALEPILKGIRRTTPNASAVLVIPCYPHALYDDCSTGFLNQAAYYTYMDYVYEVAQAFNCVVVNMHTRWGNTPFAQGFVANNDIHPKDAGHQDIANAILSIL